MNSELKYLYEILEELEEKYKNTSISNELTLDRLYELNEEILQLKKVIEEKEEEQKKIEYLKKYYEIEEEQNCSCSQDPDNFSLSKRLIPVDNDGEPIQDLGNGKWTRKK